jgi:hypothetical protein
MVYKKYNIPKELKNDVWAFVNENEMGQRFEFNGTKEQQFIGLVGEIMVKMLFGIMGRNVDIQDYFVNNFVEHQIKFDCDIYIFCSLNRRKNELTICGYLSKKELLEKSVYRKKGESLSRSNGTSFVAKTNNLEVQYKQMNNIEKLFYYLPKYLK